MNILLVDDTSSKIAAITECIKQTEPDARIDIVDNCFGAIRRMELDSYDLLILDLLLPIRSGENPSDAGGRTVLRELIDGQSCRRPSHIICLTAFEDLRQIIKNEAEANLVHVVTYDDKGAWESALSPKIEYVRRRLKQSQESPTQYLIDVAIITSSPLVEFQEVNKLPGPFVAEYNRIDQLYYFRTSWKGNPRPLEVVACAAPTMGMSAAAITASKMINRWRPRFLVMTGIAAATKESLGFGDILVAEASYDYGSGKIVDLNGKRSFVPSPNQLRIDSALYSLLQRSERDQLYMKEIAGLWTGEPVKPPRMVLGLLASGAAVVQSPKLVDEILSNSRKVVGLEMESYGVFQAAHLSQFPQPRILVAKSVSDHADGAKSDTWQRYAAFTSAQFVYHFFVNSDVMFDKGNVEGSRICANGG